MYSTTSEEYIGRSRLEDRKKAGTGDFCSKIYMCRLILTLLYFKRKKERKKRKTDEKNENGNKRVMIE